MWKMNNKTNKTVAKKVLSLSLTVFFVFTLCLCLYIAIQSLTVGYVSLFKKSFFRVITGSMEPTISVGELIITDNVDISEVKVDDVISFKSRAAEMFGAIITHRVTEVKTNDAGKVMLVSKGDANLSVDSHYVLEENFIGKVVWNSGDSKISNVVGFLSSPSGFFICIVLPCVFIFLGVLHENTRSMKRDMDVLLKKIKEKEQEQDGLTETKSLINEEELNQMRERIRKELMEELINQDESEQS